MAGTRSPCGSTDPATWCSTAFIAFVERLRLFALQHAKPKTLVGSASGQRTAASTAAPRTPVAQRTLYSPSLPQASGPNGKGTPARAQSIARDDSSTE
ncbi:unnamed protein product [Protopolystoma xenopodis]|uniref:Uncharacterized protein n=1 Tax=Protopolystoma xenopodis TaxID=117903 RepID=A0A3S5B0D4_9PLAT|nr:unnamed protein product [Protopolystoma xenopodis]